MNTHKGMIVLFVLVSLVSLLLLGTVVFYQAFYAYNSVQKRVQAYQHEYALDGLINHAINQCRAAEHAHTPITRECSQVYTPWLVSQARTYNGTLLMTPTQSGYTLVAHVTQGGVTMNRETEIKF